jgi:hypothetical protein
MDGLDQLRVEHFISPYLRRLMAKLPGRSFEDD